MADRIITVTGPSVVTNDTLAGYNNYSDIDGQLGTTMTPTEATNGKTVTLSDGSVHEVTTKPVGTTNGEFSAVVSNAVQVDLSDSYLLDTYTGSAGAWSLQQLKTGVTDVMLARRSSDDAELDFTPTEITDGTLATWAGAGDAFVKTIYDQSGNADHMIQTTTTLQPQIVASGVVVTSNAIPAMDFSGGSLLQSTTVPFYTGDEWTIHAAFELTSISEASQSIVNQHTSGGDVGRTVFVTVESADLTTVQFFNNGTSYGQSYSTSWTTGNKIVSNVGNGAGTYKFKKFGGALETILTGQTLTPVSESLNIGAQGSGFAGLFTGKFKELIVWKTDEESDITAVQSNISSRY